LDFQEIQTLGFLSHPTNTLSKKPPAKTQVPTWSDMFVYFSSVSGINTSTKLPITFYSQTQIHLNQIEA